MTDSGLADLLSQQLIRLDQLLALLEQETDALVQRDVDLIEQLLKRKLTMLDEVKAADDTLGRHPQRALLKTDPTLAEQVEQGKDKLVQCQQRNAHNQEQAELVAASLTRLQQVLQSAHKSHAMTYTGEGGTHVGQRLGRTIKA
ncbi:flagella synthesis protein FlgN [Ferrimonas marina]|uniref:Flagella synthesis protein FlgN n=1 Tax=Ferrimonas marina TaxID=299255 RepID=A0A1M5YCM1_9GAMM|nr:flagellar protein FlgN [Ferrimonas marina]SHI09273.1 flagella synthesis protein FlgN [Ferrimonas marina]